MGKIQGKILAIAVLLLIISCEEKSGETGSLMDYVPQNASMVFKIGNYDAVRADIANNPLFSKLDGTAPISFFSGQNEFLKNLHPSSQSLLCINTLNDSVSAYTFICRQSKNLLQLDSIKNKSVETLNVDGQSLQRTTIEDEIAFSALIDSVFVVSSSQKILQEILKGNSEKDATFKKVYDLPSSGEFTALLRGGPMVANDSIKINFTSWSALDLNIKPEAFSATGITLATDTIPQLLNVFEGQIPQQNDIAALVPPDALYAKSFTFNDAEKFQKNLRNYRREKETVASSGIFGSASEVGAIETKSGTALFLKSIDASLTSDALARFVTAENEFRDVEISAFSEPSLFQKAFAPLILKGKTNHVFQLDNFFVFTENEAMAQEIITAFQNNATLRNAPFFENTSQGLSTASSLLVLKLQGDFKEAFSGIFDTNSLQKFRNIPTEDYPLAALQFSYDRNFAHTTFICNEAAGEPVSRGAISEKFHVKLDNSVLGMPQLFDGRSTNVVVQDIGNTLYFISEGGKIIWKKKLDSAILGKIQEVDIFGNGNKQLAFATHGRLYILDRNGNDVGAFPLKFKDKITQPLSVFDYDHNHKYRFVVTQGKEVLMYDKSGKTVKGFGFNRAKSNIVHPPQHIRMGNRDYIVIAEENGKLNILSRVGKPRISVSKTFNFSEIQVAEEDNTFVVITKENTKERIAQSGKVSSQKLEVGGNYWFAVSGNTKVTLDDNLLRIDGKLAELPLGLYTRPQIFSIHRQTYITITETQENKVYVFNREGQLLTGFPVYGTSAAFAGEGDRKGAISLVVKGEADSVILYSGN